MIKHIKYYSTNHNSPIVSFKDALIRGQAPDKGLYMPERIPKISIKKILDLKNTPYHEIAFVIMHEFLKSEIPDNVLKKITKDAYNFTVPIEQFDDNKYILRLDRGPTASFKDFAALIMAKLMHYYIKDEKKKLLILTATSGDTGSAVANAFHNMDNIQMIVLFPYKEVSKIQRKQMTTLGKNIIAIAIDGKFDDCQTMVKKAFSDPELKYLNLSSANSINIGRLLPQIVYYFYAYSRLAKNQSDKIIFSVPCGNFGNLTAGLIAKKMGLPVFKFIAAVNENDEIPKFLKTGKYKPINPSKICISNAMNVGHPSNLSRIIDLYNGQMNENGKIVKMPDMNSLKKDVFSVSVSDDETKQIIKTVYNHGILLEPHGAVGWRGLEIFLFQKNNKDVCVSLETAHPAKFPETIKKLLNIKPKLPTSIKKLENKREKFKIMSTDYKELKEFLKKKF